MEAVIFEYPEYVDNPREHELPEESARRIMSLGGHIVLCGLDGLGFRTMEELLRLGEHVVAIDGLRASSYAGRAEALGVPVIRGDCREEAILREAGIDTARSLVVANEDDVVNLHAALTAQDINPALRIVLRMFNVELGRRIERLFNNCAVLSSSAIAAPAFVAAALYTQSEQQIEVDGQVFTVYQASKGETGVILPLVRRHADGAIEIFPSDPSGAICLAREHPLVSSQPEAVHRWQPKNALADVRAVWSAFLHADRRFLYVLLLISVLALVSIVVFHYFDNLDISDAIYFTLTIITTTGFGDISLLHAPIGLKLYGAMLMVLGAACLTLFYALITDAIVSARLARALGAARIPLHDHVVVCGLGNIGYRVVERIAKMGIPVAAVELHEGARFLPTVRRLGVPVLVADSRVPETLHALGVDRARCLIVATDDDIANLETALNARSLKPNLRVVLRLFEPDLAARVERTFSIQTSRSVSALAAPAFASAAMGRQVVTTIAAGPLLLLVAKARVESGAWVEGRTVRELEEAAEGRVLLFGNGGKLARPQVESILTPGLDMIVVATRRGLSQILDRIESNSQVGAP